MNNYYTGRKYEQLRRVQLLLEQFNNNLDIEQNGVSMCQGLAELRHASLALHMVETYILNPQNDADPIKFFVPTYSIFSDISLVEVRRLIINHIDTNIPFEQSMPHALAFFVLDNFGHLILHDAHPHREMSIDAAIRRTVEILQQNESLY